MRQAGHGVCVGGEGNGAGPFYVTCVVGNFILLFHEKENRFLLIRMATVTSMTSPSLSRSSMNLSPL